jgi:vacuolar iron transporter family protein
MAAAEDRHAQTWMKMAFEAGARIPPFRLSLRTRLYIRMAKTFGPGFILPALAGREGADSGSYLRQPEAKGMGREERSHMQLLTEISHSSPVRGLDGGELARLEGRHRLSGGNALRAAVLGANDGLVSNLSLVMGVAGAHASSESILVAGVAGLAAGACSMALGEWLSVQSSRESYQKQIDLEREEIEATPLEEAEELTLIYEAKGFSEPEARRMAEKVLSETDRAVETMAREELGIDPEKLGGSAWTAATASFLLFAFGAAVPVAPFVFLSGAQALLTALAAGSVALFLLGSAVTLFTGRSAVLSGMRQVGFGWVAAALTYGMGGIVGAFLIR